jgi:hypothetical protein
MNAPDKPEGKPVKHPPRPAGEEIDVDKLVERTMRRYPKTMARLAE